MFKVKNGSQVEPASRTVQKPWTPTHSQESFAQVFTFLKSLLPEGPSRWTPSTIKNIKS